MESDLRAQAAHEAVTARSAEIGKIRRVPLREVWAHEAYDFTAWLEENLDVLNDVLDLRLVDASRELAAGSFSVDLVAEDEAGGRVVIENQLEKSNHDHLGKVITYLAAMEARAAVWIVSEPRPEHIRAVGWLNESSADFYLLKVEAIRIGDSPAAPLLTLIAGPSEETRRVRETKKEFGERHEIRLRWWSELLEKAKTKTRLHAAISPSRYGSVGTGAGKRGLSFNYDVAQHETWVELYIDRGHGQDRENLEVFEALRAKQEEIEQTFGRPLVWQALEGKRACRILAPIIKVGYRDPEDEWPRGHEQAIDEMVRLEAALRPHISALPM
jgi:hypothetical protein